VPDLARLYDLHAEDCVRTAEKIDNPSHHAMLLKAAAEWRQAAQAQRQLQHPSPSQEQPPSQKLQAQPQPHIQEEAVVNPGLRGCEARAKARQGRSGKADNHGKANYRPKP
jgi:hypothetical protein